MQYKSSKVHIAVGDGHQAHSHTLKVVSKCLKASQMCQKPFSCHFFSGFPEGAKLILTSNVNPKITIVSSTLYKSNSSASPMLNFIKTVLLQPLFLHYKQHSMQKSQVFHLPVQNSSNSSQKRRTPYFYSSQGLHGAVQSKSHNCFIYIQLKFLTPSSFSSAPSVTACIVAQTSSKMLMMPGSVFDSISSQTILLLK